MFLQNQKKTNLHESSNIPLFPLFLLRTKLGKVKYRPTCARPIHKYADIKNTIKGFINTHIIMLKCFH